MKTPADQQTLLKTVRGFFEKQVLSLNGLLGTLPEQLKAEVQKMRDGFNETLAKLPPLEQVSAATEIAGSMNWLECVIDRLTSTADEAMTRATDALKSLQEKTTAMCSLEEKLKTDFVTKEASTAAVDTARADERALLLPEISATRKSALELAGLPCPSDDVLGLPAADYQTRLTGAQANVAALGAKGLKLGGRGDALVQKTAWLVATEFAGRMQEFEDLLTPAKTTPAPDPLLGAGDAKDEAGKTLGKSKIPVGMA